LLFFVLKFLQFAMTKLLAPELAKFKIRINVVCPGAIETSETHSLPSCLLPSLPLLFSPLSFLILFQTSMQRQRNEISTTYGFPSNFPRALSPSLAKFLANLPMWLKHVYFLLEMVAPLLPLLPPPPSPLTYLLDMSGHITGTEIYIDGGESLVAK
jgi:NAD(P)-dependent dehydrogenase (short-subunit alcohol dehydrogenase family)